MLDLEHDQLVRLADAGRHLPPRRGGAKPHPATLYRWAKGGLRGTRLETIRVGGTLCTSMGALQRFCDRLTGPAPAPTAPTPTANRRAARRAGQALDRLGF